MNGISTSAVSAKRNCYTFLLMFGVLVLRQESPSYDSGNLCYSCPMGSYSRRTHDDSLRGHSEGRNVALKFLGKGVGGVRALFLELVIPLINILD